MAEEIDIIVEADGTLTFLHDDRVAALFADEPDQTTTRVSHVEPAAHFGWDHANGWLADMRPVKGPLLYARVINGVKQPFPTRQAALDAERAWWRREQGL